MDKVQDNTLTEVTGGTEAESREIYEFIKIHDPELFARGEAFAKLAETSPYHGAQIMVEQALGFKVVLVAEVDRIHNVYVDVDGGRRYSQEEVMQLLREKYGA